MKFFLKKAIPLFFVDIFNKVVDLLTTKYPNWEIYKSQSSFDYNQKMLAYSVYLKTQKFKNKSFKKGIISDKSLKDSVEILFNFFDHDEMNVIDYGGASGYCYYALKKLGYSGVLKWNIIETDEMVKINESNNSDELYFYRDLSNMPAPKKLDLVLFNSVLQYLPDCLEILNEIFLLNPLRVHIRRTPFLKEKDYWSIQKSRLKNNGSGDIDENIGDHVIRYPVHSMSLVNFLDYLDQKEHYNFNVFCVGNWVINGKEHGLYDIYIYKNGLN